MPYVRRIQFILPLALLPVLTTGCRAEEPARVQTGAEVLLDRQLDLLRGKNVGLITNHTGVLPDGRALYAALGENGIYVKALFSPEHGLQGSAQAGAKTESGIDSLTGIPVHSLYGKTQKPTPEMLEGIDALVYDIQDVGVRFYTYISTMGLAMEASAAAGIPFVVLDRPNPQGGIRIEGPVMQDSLKSFIGMFSLPVLYGLTCGERALMIAGEGWIGGSKPDLHVIPMAGWKREMDWGATGLPWIAPSPNIPDPETVIIYPATCYLEATQVSEGRGTKEPFRMIGAPFIDSEILSRSLSGIKGIEAVPATFVPDGSKHKGLTCNGVRLSVTRLDNFRASEAGIRLLAILLQLYPSEIEIQRNGLERLIGSRPVVKNLLSRQDLTETLARVDDGVGDFRIRREQYLLYP
jgi:uncharacterized protein YbbC (DUF1343 family)